MKSGKNIFDLSEMQLSDLTATEEWEFFSEDNTEGDDAIIEQERKR
jgi:hypothetical protein